MYASGVELPAVSDLPSEYACGSVSALSRRDCDYSLRTRWQARFVPALYGEHRGDVPGERTLIDSPAPHPRYRYRRCWGSERSAVLTAEGFPAEIVSTAFRTAVRKRHASIAAELFPSRFSDPTSRSAFAHW
jgi:hypothetical protein